MTVNCAGTLVYTVGHGNLSSDFNKKCKGSYIVAVMRKVVLLLFMLWGQMCLAQGGAVSKSGESLDKETGSSFCPLDSIPDWVKEKTTQKE